MPIVKALRRYPVKSMGGESLDSVALDGRGVAGDRWYAVVDEDGRLASGKNSRRFRRYDEVFTYSAASADDGVTVSLDGTTWPVGSGDLDAELSRSFGVRVRVRPEEHVPHQDAGAVSLVGTATLAWCAARWGGADDPRRIRANVLVETDEPFEEEAWAGHLVEVGGVFLRVSERIPRCRMIDLDQDGVVSGADWLKPLTAEREMCLGVYADVERPGVIAVGDELRLPY